jgi:polyisoprenoid-binding protein YceI
MTTQLQTEQGIVRVPSGTWTVDPSHSSVGFEVRHMMIATVRGRFRDFEGTIVAADELTESRVSGKASVASIDTGQADRDTHLRSPDFFDAERFREISFTSTHIEHVEGGMFRVVGDLTIRDQTREISLATVVHGAGEDPWGNERVGLAARAVINRTDFGLTWQQRLARGGVLVGDEVTIVLDVPRSASTTDRRL